MYCGHTIFSLFYDKEQIYVAIKDLVCNNDYEPEDQLGQEVENSFLRRLIKILVLPTKTLLKDRKVFKTYKQNDQIQVMVNNISIRNERISCLSHDYLSMKLSEFINWFP